MDKFFADAVKKTEQRGKETGDATTEVATDGEALKKFPRGVVLGKDGKPCRTCTSSAEWRALTKKMKASPSISSQTSSPISSQSSTTTLPPTTTSSSSSSPSTSYDGPPPDCPPDVDVLGKSTWTLLHSISASYPPIATSTQQSEMKQFLSLFSKLYPCWVCAEDFRDWMGKRGNEPKVAGREDLGKWMCEAHNEVNRKLGKEEFDCALWKERWRTGWKDGRCD